MRYALIAISALSLAAMPAGAVAQDFVVKHDDLDLSSPKGQKKLKGRIVVAAREYCAANTVSTGSRIRSPEYLDCYETAKKLANEQMASLIEQSSQKGG